MTAKQPAKPCCRHTFPALVFVACILAAACRSNAGSWIGDAGHFFVHTPDIFMNNPSGIAFTVTVHRHVWPADWANKGEYQLKVFAPDGAEAASGSIPISNENCRIEVPAGRPGVWRLGIKPGGYGLTWVECSLPQMVIANGDWDQKDGPFRTCILHVMAPRRWYFFVPAGVKSFRVKHIIQPFQSHREDYGFFIMSPRGQRVAALYGGKPLDVETRSPNTPVPVETRIEVDEGAGGRFWSIWATGGDSHNFSDLQILLDGVPPFMAPSPEQWFDPASGRPPDIVVYDNSAVRLRDTKNEKGEPVSRDHYLWTPVPFLGDEDYNGWRGPQTIYWSNPSNLPVELGVVTYIADDSARFPVKYSVFSPAGRLIAAREDVYGHHLSSRLQIPASGPGVYRAQIEAGRWFSWMEPAPPVVIAGKPADGGGARFEIETGIARHWFFKVPAGAGSFRMAVSVADPDHVLHVEIHAPDRLMDAADVRGGAKREMDIAVPKELAGRIWFFRVEIGSATRFVSGSFQPRHVNVEADMTLYGVPGFLAPTWEQWFDPTVR